jgi:hypothetical protein
MSAKNSFIVVGILAAAVLAAVGLAVSTMPELGIDGNTDKSSFASVDGRGTISIVTLEGDQLVGGATYRITPDPFVGTGNFTIKDDDDSDSSRSPGIISVKGVRDSVYVVVQVVAPQGHQVDLLPRAITISGENSESVVFGGDLSAQSGQSDGAGQKIQSIQYIAKFECGSIRGSEGPLRPGHYDTDIGIFNKQGFPVRISWSAIPHDSVGTSAILKTLESETSTSIVCEDLRNVIGKVTRDFVEGFALIEVSLDSRLLGSVSAGGTEIFDSSQDRIDVLDVQVFYTANALEELPRAVMVDKIAFVISSDASGKIPGSIIGETLTIATSSNSSGIRDPVQSVRDALAQEYDMTAQEVAAFNIEIKDVDVGVGTMIDDHAISLSKVRPQARIE